jgi:hypothetical protein
LSLFKKERHAVATLLLGLEGERAAPVARALGSAQEAIMEAGGDFDVASREVSRVASLLLEHQEAWRSAANFGESFTRAAEAGDYGEEVFTELSHRHVDVPGEDPSADAGVPGTVVVMLTVAYRGQVPVLEVPLHARDQVAEALKGVISLAGKGQLLLAHLHVAPAEPGRTLSEDQLMVGFPELVDL